MSVVHCPGCEVQWDGQFTACWLCGGPPKLGVYRDGNNYTYPWSKTVIVPVYWDAEDLEEVVNL